MPNVTLRELAQLVGGQVIGDPGLTVQDALPIQDVTATCITLADSKEQLEKAEQSKAVAVVVSQVVSACGKALIVVTDIHEAFIQIIARLRPCSIFPTRSESQTTVVSELAVVDPTSSIGYGTLITSGVNIAANCVIGCGSTLHSNVTVMEGCRLGDDCELFPGVVLYPGTIVGNRTVIHANAVLGAYGFGYRQKAGKHLRTAQLGWVELGDDVEIGAGTTIDRGSYGPTRIGHGTKIDNLVQIGHNCHIGQHNLICSQVGVAGSCSTGDYVVMGGQAGLKDHLRIGTGAMLAARAGLMYDVPDGEIVFGSPAGPRKEKLREQLLIGKLPEFKRELQQLSRRLQELEAISTQSPAVQVKADEEDSGDKRAA